MIYAMNVPCCDRRGHSAFVLSDEDVNFHYILQDELVKSCEKYGIKKREQQKDSGRCPERR